MATNTHALDPRHRAVDLVQLIDPNLHLMFRAAERRLESAPADALPLERAVFASLALGLVEFVDAHAELTKTLGDLIQTLSRASDLRDAG